jgi:hypothetical protein
MHQHQRKRKLAVPGAQYTEECDSEGGVTSDASVELEQQEFLYQTEFYDYQLSERVLEFSDKEWIVHGDVELKVPFDLLQRHVFDQVFSMDTWNNLLTQEERRDLIDLLPDESVVQPLLTGQVFMFNNPLELVFQSIKGTCVYSLSICNLIIF